MRMEPYSPETAHYVNQCPPPPYPGPPSEYQQQPQPQVGQAPVVYVIQAPAVVEQPAGRFARHDSSLRAIRVCGRLLITTGVLAMCGAGLETGAFAYLWGTYPYYYATNKYYSLTDYCGYWCGAILIVCGSIGVRSFLRRTNCMIVTVLIAAIIAVAFSLVLIILPAEALPAAYDYGATVQPMLLGAYGTMIGAGSLGTLLALILVSSASVAIKTGNNR